MFELSNSIFKTKFKLRILVLIFSFHSMVMFAQEANDNFGMAYLDYRNYLYFFKDGIPQQLESQAVRNFNSKGEIVGYVNSANNLIAYYNGEKTDLGDATNTTFNLTNHLLIYQRDQVLGVFDKGKLTRLTYFLRDYKINDELIAFRDQNIDILKLYYNGKVQDLEYTLIGSLGAYKVGKNTVAYMSSSGYFKIFDDGQVFEIDNIAPIQFDAGKNIVGYVDGSQQSLNVFYNTKVLTLEPIKPLSFQVGDDLMAYVSDEGYFKIFTQGKLLKAESYAPDFYQVLNSSVLFFADNKLQVLQKGIRYVLDDFKPLSYKMNENAIAWQDPAKRLHVFVNGQVKSVTSEIFVGYELNGDILRYQLEDGTSHIYFNGKNY